MRNAFLLLADGRSFVGQVRSESNFKEVVGEAVFSTNMTGYLETITDPSYFGQIVVQTFPFIGNYGLIPQDFEADKPALTAYITRDICEEPSNFRSEGVLADYLEEKGIPYLFGVDTREITKIIREKGVINALITLTNPEENPEFKKEALAKLSGWKIKDALANVTSNEPKTYNKDKNYNVALMDFGAKRNIIAKLQEYGCNVTTFPAETKAEEIFAGNFDGIMLSNGPGDPYENTGIIEEIRKLAEAKMPIFGICLGHQLLALAMGGSTKKMHYGHRGSNQPVFWKSANQVFITSQNHGYAVEDIPAGIGEIDFINENDRSCEGIQYSSIPAFSVQFHPEAAAGPLDTGFLFGRFIDLMEEEKNAKR